MTMSSTVQEMRLLFLWSVSVPATLLSLGPQSTVTAQDSGPKKLLFASNRDGKAKWHIFAADSDGSNLVKLSRGEALHFDPIWSPDGKKIAFVALINEKDKKTDLYVMDADGSNRERLTTNPKGTVAWSPSWFPDGK